MSDASERHPPLALIESYLAQGVDGVISVQGAPAARVVIEGSRGLIGIRVPFDGEEIDVVDYENLSSAVLNDEGIEWQQLSVRLDDNLEAVYPLLTGVIDRVQLFAEPFHVAVRGVLDSFVGVLLLRRGLSSDQQVGLYGELLVLSSLAQHWSCETAIAAWRGSSREEHDFDVGFADLEVKTTRSERRSHWISSGTQLAPTGDRPLYLLSLQITAAGGDLGSSLPGLVTAIRTRFGGGSALLEDGLTKARYRDRDKDLYRSRWRLRTAAAFYNVGAEFPAITQARIDECVPSSDRIVGISYQVDLTGLAPSDALFPIVPAPEETQP